MGDRFHQVGVAATLLGLALGLGGGVAGAGTAFADPVGDVKGGPGPDLTLISLSHTRSTVTLRFRFAKAPPLGMSVEDRWVDMLLVGIDVPPRGLVRGEHGWTGLDYYAGVHGTEKAAVVVRAAPASPSQPNRVLARPKVTVSGRTLSFSIGRSTLGNPPWIELAVAAGRETSDPGLGGGGDEAPNRGTFHYRLPTSR